MASRRYHCAKTCVQNLKSCTGEILDRNRYLSVGHHGTLSHLAGRSVSGRPTITGLCRGQTVIAPRSTLHTPRLPQWIAVLLLGLLFLQTAGSAVRTSLTTDEGLHITSGYSIWRTGDYRLIEEHPPLIKMLATLPLLL